ncbi:MAG TPA: homoserine dehydrogenase [Longimicrobiales bacterium]|nr:homoserine dehydrogenase [Longimicrobiales bacterium]
MRVGVALYGFGTVGGGLADVLAARGDEFRSRYGLDLEVRYVVVRDAKRPRAGAPDGARLTDDWRAPLEDPGVGVVVEVMGGTDRAGDVVRQALASGRAVVTANKALIAADGKALERLAAAAGAALRYEAAVGGAIPILHMLRGTLVANRITRVRGIVNGTTNFILTRMEESGQSLEEALDDARRLGFAEADATADLSGLDAARKLVILARHAFGRWLPLDRVSVQGIGAVTPVVVGAARRRGERIKLIAEAALDAAGGIALRVAPQAIPEADPLARVRGEMNAIAVEGDFAGPLLLIGRGAGRHATASAVATDLVEVALGGPVGAGGR